MSLSAVMFSAAVALLVWPQQRRRRILNTARQPRLRVPGWLSKKSSTVSAVEQQNFLNRIAALLKAGRTPTQMWQEIAVVQDSEPESALHQWSRQAATLSERGEDPSRVFAQHWPVVGQCFRLSAQHGAPLAELLERYSHHLQQDQQLDELITVEAAGPKMTQKLLLLLPLGGVGIGTLLGLDLFSIYVGHPLGMVLVLAGTVLSVLAARATGKVIKEAGQRL